jgi:hypothetical protein
MWQAGTNDLSSKGAEGIITRQSLNLWVGQLWYIVTRFKAWGWEYEMKPGKAKRGDMLQQLQAMLV